MVTSTGSYSACGTAESSSTWVMQMATFRARDRVRRPPPPSRDGGGCQRRARERWGTSVTSRARASLAGATVTFGGTAATNVTVAQQHVDHGDDAGACGGSGRCGGDQHGQPEGNADGGIYLHDVESGADLTSIVPRRGQRGERR